MEAAASEALLVIINTKSFQKQQPQFPTEKEEEDGSSTKITTNFGLSPNQYTGVGPRQRARRRIQDGGGFSNALIGWGQGAGDDVTAACA